MRGSEDVWSPVTFSFR